MTIPDLNKTLLLKDSIDEEIKNFEKKDQGKKDGFFSFGNSKKDKESVIENLLSRESSYTADTKNMNKKSKL